MERVYDNCCGVDVHKKVIVAYLKRGRKQEVPEFGATTREMLEILPPICSTNANRRIRNRRGSGCDAAICFGEAPQQAFLRAYGPAKISECGHTRIACRLCAARKTGKNNEQTAPARPLLYFLLTSSFTSPEICAKAPASNFFKFCMSSES